MIWFVSMRTTATTGAEQPSAARPCPHKHSPCTKGDELGAAMQDLQKRNVRGDEPAAAMPALPSAAEDTRPLDDLLNFIEAGGRSGGSGGGRSKPRAKPRARPKQAMPAGGHAVDNISNDAERQGLGQNSGFWGRGAECEPSTSGRAPSPPRAGAGADREPGQNDPVATLDASGLAAGLGSDAVASNGSASGAAANGGAAPAAGQGVGLWAAEAAGDCGASASSTASTAGEWDASEEEAEEDLEGLGAAQDRDQAAQELSPRMDRDWVVRASCQACCCGPWPHCSRGVHRWLGRAGACCTAACGSHGWAALNVAFTPWVIECKQAEVTLQAAASMKARNVDLHLRGLAHTKQARQLGPRPGAAITTLTSLVNFRPKRPPVEAQPGRGDAPLEWGDPADVAAAERLIRRFLARAGLAAHLALVRTRGPEALHPDPNCTPGDPLAARAALAGAGEGAETRAHALYSAAAWAQHASASGSTSDASEGCCKRDRARAADADGTPGCLVVSGAAGAAHMRLELRVRA